MICKMYKDPTWRYVKFCHFEYFKDSSLRGVRGNPVWIFHGFVSFGYFLTVTWGYFKGSSPLGDNSGVLLLWILLEFVIWGYFRGLSLGDTSKVHHLGIRKGSSLGDTSGIPHLGIRKGSSLWDTSGFHHLGIL